MPLHSREFRRMLGSPPILDSTLRSEGAATSCRSRVLEEHRRDSEHDEEAAQDMVPRDSLSQNEGREEKRDHDRPADDRGNCNRGLHRPREAYTAEQVEVADLGRADT